MKRPGPRGAAGKAVLLRLTPTEHSTLTAAADRSGLRVGPWLRSVGLYMASRDDLHPLAPRSPRRSDRRKEKP